MLVVCISSEIILIVLNEGKSDIRQGLSHAQGVRLRIIKKLVLPPLDGRQYFDPHQTMSQKITSSRTRLPSLPSWTVMGEQMSPSIVLNTFPRLQMRDIDIQGRIREIVIQHQNSFHQHLQKSGQ